MKLCSIIAEWLHVAKYTLHILRSKGGGLVSSLTLVRSAAGFRAVPILVLVAAFTMERPGALALCVLEGSRIYSHQGLWIDCLSRP